MTTFFSYKKQPSYSRLKWKWWTKGGFVSYCNYTGNLPTAVICPRLCHAEPGFPSTRRAWRQCTPGHFIKLLSPFLLWALEVLMSMPTPPHAHVCPPGQRYISSFLVWELLWMQDCALVRWSSSFWTNQLYYCQELLFFLIILHLYHSKNYLNNQVDSLQILFSGHWLPTFLFDQTEILMRFSS